MATILFDIFPATGHYNACLRFAGRLAEKHRIVFICEKKYKQTIVQSGFEYYLLEKSFLPERFSVRNTRYWIYLFYYSLSIMNSGDDKKYIQEEILNYKAMLEEIQPDLIFLDSHHYYKKLVYDSSTARLVRLQTMQSTRRRALYPPICYDYLPGLTKSGIAFSSLLWKWNFLKSTMLLAIDRLLFPGKNLIDHLIILSEYCGIDLYKNIDHDRYTPRGIEIAGGEEVILPPVAFDFPGKGILLGYRRTPSINNHGDHISPRYMECIKQVEQMRSQGRKVVYVSLGTLSTNEEKIALRFYAVIKKVCEEMKSTSFILSISKDVFPMELMPFSANTFVFKKVPQLHLLGYCDLMITHGGMNSITECIEKEIPMLVYPLDKSWDQPGNASRVVYHGLGLKGNIRRATPRSIRQKVDLIWEDYALFKKNIKKMKDRIATEPDNGLNYINSLLP